MCIKREIEMNVDKFYAAKYSQKNNIGHFCCTYNVHIHWRALDSGPSTKLFGRCDHHQHPLLYTSEPQGWEEPGNGRSRERSCPSLDVRGEGEKWVGIGNCGVVVVLLFTETRQGGRMGLGKKMSSFGGMLSVKYLWDIKMDISPGDRKFRSGPTDLGMIGI